MRNKKSGETSHYCLGCDKAKNSADKIAIFDLIDITNNR